MQRPVLSVIAIFYNMRREAERTLYSLTEKYQRGVSASEYEVLAVDNGSREPLSAEMVKGFGNQFEHYFEATDSPSPCAAINRAVDRARADHVVVIIDGARMLSPGILGMMKRCIHMVRRCFVYTLAMHLGPEIQNISLCKGYNQSTEDEMLGHSNWRTDGYELFRISTVAVSSGRGFFSPLVESNCVALEKGIFLRMGGFCEAFRAPGGGLANLDFFNRMTSLPEVCPIMLLGEATFHQFHGGVATNVAMEDHPAMVDAEEYKRIRGHDFQPVGRRPLYVGSYRDVCKDLYGAVD